MALRAHGKAKTILTDTCTGVNQAQIANQTVADGCTGTDFAARTNNNTVANHRVGRNDCAVPDFTVCTNHGTGINLNPGAKLGRWINHRTIRNNAITRFKWIIRRCGLGIGAVGIIGRKKHHVFGGAICKFGTHETRTSATSDERINVFAIVKEAQDHAVGDLQRCDIIKTAFRIRCIDRGRTSQLSDILNTERSFAMKETRISHYEPSLNSTWIVGSSALMRLRISADAFIPLAWRMTSLLRKTKVDSRSSASAATISISFF